MRIKELLKEKSITQKELANRMGITQSTLSILLNGNMTIATLNRIASALGVEVSDLYAAPSIGGGSSPSVAPVEDSPRIQENRVFVVCPKCGEKIPIELHTSSNK